MGGKQTRRAQTAARRAARTDRCAHSRTDGGAHGWPAPRDGPAAGCFLPLQSRGWRFVLDPDAAPSSRFRIRSGTPGRAAKRAEQPQVQPAAGRAQAQWPERAGAVAGARGRPAGPHPAKAAVCESPPSCVLTAVTFTCIFIVFLLGDKFCGLPLNLLPKM